MVTPLSYGLNATCLLDSAEVIELRPPVQPTFTGEALVAAVETQLANPLDYPSLSSATIPGDQIALAIDPAIPQPVSLIRGALQALRAAGAEQDCVTILLSGGQDHREARATALQAELANFGYADCHVITHRPDDEKQRAFLGVTKAGRALRLNRHLCDADFVLPIGVTVAPQQSSGSPTSFGGLFPVFSDPETIQQFSTSIAEDGAPASQEGWHELEECGRLLGVGMTLQVVPGRGGEVSAVLAGQPQSVARRAVAKYGETWSCATESRGNLVIVTLPGDASQQTWQNLGRTLAAAETVLETGGAIAICSELAEPPGPALGHLVGNEDAMVVERAILREASADRGPALQLCRALQRGAIYLRSELAPTVVESLGMTPLESDNELEHLADALRPCLVLEEAHRLLPTIVDSVAGRSAVGQAGLGEAAAVETETRSA